MDTHILFLCQACCMRWTQTKYNVDLCAASPGGIMWIPQTGALMCGRTSTCCYSSCSWQTESFSSLRDFQDCRWWCLYSFYRNTTALSKQALMQFYLRYDGVLLKSLLKGMAKKQGLSWKSQTNSLLLIILKQSRSGLVYVIVEHWYESKTHGMMKCR